MTLWRPADGIHVLKDIPLLVTALVVLNDVKDSCDFCQSLRSLSAVKILEFYDVGRKLTIQNKLQWCRKFINLVSLTVCQWCLDVNLWINWLPSELTNTGVANSGTGQGSLENTTKNHWQA